MGSKQNRQQLWNALRRWAAITLVVVLAPGPNAFAAITVTHTFPAGWNIVTVPVKPTNPDPAAVFDELPSPRRIYDYRAGLEVAPGEPGFRNLPTGSGTGAAGYWMLFPQATNVAVTGDEPSRSVPYHTTIAPGWNVVGSPWRSSVPWTDARILVSDGATTKVLSEAVTAGWIQGTLRAWDDAAPGGGGYVELLANAGGSLPPWLGFEMYSTVTGTLIFAPPPPDTTAPVVDIESPAEIAQGNGNPPAWPRDGHEIRKMTPVLGKVVDDNVASWTLTFTSLELGSTITLATGNTEVPAGGFLGSLDPTLQLNGMGILTLSAVDVGGLQATPDEELVAIGGDNKLGNFQLTFIDLEVPVAGIPISLRRTYDTRRRGAAQDFGYGWQLEVFAPGRYLRNRKPGNGWSFSNNGFGACANPQPELTHVVEVRISDREFYRFAPIVTNPSGSYPSCFGRVRFVQVGGSPGAQLVDLDDGNPENPQGIEVGWINGDLGDPDTFDTYDPLQVRMKRLDGQKLYFNLIGSGTSPRGLYKVEDRNGNTLDIRTNGVTWSNPVASPGVTKGISINRTAGRVTSIVDPEAMVIPYEYDAAGNLTLVRDRTLNKTTFQYDASHLMLGITDPLNSVPMRPAFDAWGRLTSWTDADGNATTLQTDAANNHVVITNREGEASTYFYGDDGYLKETTQPGNVRTSYLYDVRGNVTIERDPLQHESRYEYNANDRLTKLTNALNLVTQYFYDDPTNKTRVTKTVQPMGDASESFYDAQGNLTRTKDPLGRVQDYTYNLLGRRATESLPHDVTEPPACFTTFSYDVHGNMTRTVDALGNAQDFEYDQSHRQTRAIVHRSPAPGQPPAAETSSMMYDAQGRLTKRTDELGHASVLMYDAAGRLTKELGPLGHATVTQYDLRNNITKRIDEDGNFEQYLYDLEGRKTTSLDRAGRMTSYFFDDLGRLTRTEHPDLARDDSFYDDAGRLTKTRNPRGFDTTLAYDAAGRLTQTADAQMPPAVTTNEYDPNGRLTKVTDPNHHETRFLYDAAGHRTRTVFHDATSRTVFYDEAGRLTKQLDQNDKATTFDYDCVGRLLGVTDPLNNRTSYGYDEVGNVTAQTNANGHTTQMRYDALGRLANRILPMSQVDHRGYDPEGNIETRTDYSGRVTTYLYDSLNRLTRKRYPSGNGTTADVSFAYTLTGRRASMADGVGTTSYEYDGRDRLTKVTDPYARVVRYAYDSAGNRTSVVTPATATTFAFDPVNRLTAVADASGTFSYGYDAAGNRTRLTFPNGVSTAYTPDALNRLKVIDTRKSDGTPIAHFSYALDNAGNRTAVQELGRAVTWAYDDAYRLTSEAILAAGSTIVTYAYDNVGNRVQRLDNGSLAQVIEYDANDRIEEVNGVRYDYDANGNQLGDPITGQVYSWDLEDRLLGVTGGGHTVGSLYNGEGMRLQTAIDGITRQHVIDPNTRYYRVLEEWDPAGALDVAYTYGDALIKQSIGPSYYHADAIGSTRVVTDDSQSVVNAYAFEAFGATSSAVAAVSNRYLFAGEESVLELYNLRARYMDPRHGRFLGRDRASGSSAQPMSQHPYMYGLGRPTMVTDPSGYQGLEGVTFTAVLGDVVAYKPPLQGPCLPNLPPRGLPGPDTLTSDPTVQAAILCMLCQQKRRGGEFVAGVGAAGARHFVNISGPGKRERFTGMITFVGLPKAVFHTHPKGDTATPSGNDKYVAETLDTTLPGINFEVPIYTLHPTQGFSKYNPAPIPLVANPEDSSNPPDYRPGGTDDHARWEYFGSLEGPWPATWYQNFLQCGVEPCLNKGITDGTKGGFECQCANWLPQ